MSAIFRPARGSSFSAANKGSSSMITGSPAVTVSWWIRASGARPCALSAASETTMTAADPSQIWLAEAALITPPSLSNLTEAMPSRLASKRMPSSTSWTWPSSSATGTISAANAPASVAALARRWLASAYSSSLSREYPYFLAIISAPTNWLKKGTPYLPVTLSGNGRNPWSGTIDSPIGARLMLSTPAAITTSWVPDITAWAANWIACCEEPHWRSMVTAGTLSGRSFEASTALRPTWSACSPAWVTQPMITSSIAARSPRRGGASQYRAAVRRGIDPAAVGGRIEADRGEFDGVDAGKAPGGADGSDD